MAKSKKRRLPQESRPGVPHHESPEETEVQEVEQQPEEITITTQAETSGSGRATSTCETGKEAACSCRCRGKYHGKPHPQGWKDEEGCEPLTKEERKVAKKNALYAWRKAHPERVSAYMKQWREARKSEEKEAEIVEAKEAVEEEDADN